MPSFKRPRSSSTSDRALAKLVAQAAMSAAPQRPLYASNYRTGGYEGLEVKFLDSTKAATAVVATAAGAEQDPATANCLNGVAQGDGESNRDGRKYTIKRVSVHGTVNLVVGDDQASAIGGVGVRVMLVHDSQTNGAQLNSEDVVADVANFDYLSFRNLQYEKRFKVLAEKTLTLDYINSQTDGSNTASLGGQRKHFSFDKKLNMPVICTGTTGTVAAISDNSLHLIAIASTGVICQVAYNARIRFVG